MDWLIGGLVVLALVIFVWWIVPRIKVIPEGVRPILIGLAFLADAIWLIRNVLPRVIG